MPTLEAKQEEVIVDTDETTIAKTTTLEDGRVVDEDGVVVGFETPAEFGAEHRAAFNDDKPESAEIPVFTEKFVNWIMSKKLKYEAAKTSAYSYSTEAADKCKAIDAAAIERALSIARLTPEYIEASAIERNASKMVDDADKALDYFKGYDSELGRYAKSKLKPDGPQNLKTPFGSIFLRKSPDTIQPKDDAKAVAWAEKNAPGAVTKTFKKTEVDKGLWNLVKERLSNPKPKGTKGDAVALNGIDKIFEVKVGETKVTVSANIEGVK